MNLKNKGVVFNHESVREAIGVNSLQLAAQQVFAIARKLSRDYQGEEWVANVSETGAVFWSPVSQGVFFVRVRGFSRSVNAETFGLLVSLVALTKLSESYDIYYKAMGLLTNFINLNCGPEGHKILSIQVD
jgi:hypothetical protein